ncbi:unnamed protein product [Phytophthora fragariaefolia]|uniref:Unnamed protein product n=1 Tax=Phytophthora fragariaefolia TaxID=1490495 RepID=A0A9W6XIR2_9STRA|nr:unnamed protein product [Phytophthora fragariaefolia]
MKRYLWPEPPERPNDGNTESSHIENGETSPGAAERPPSAEDVDPLEVPEVERRGVARLKTRGSVGPTSSWC